jgi:hypothetical protein
MKTVAIVFIRAWIEMTVLVGSIWGTYTFISYFL